MASGLDFGFVAYGGGEIYSSVFNSVALLCGTSGIGSLIKLAMVVGLMVGVFQVVFNAKVGDVLKWFITSYLILSIFFVPKVTVHIEDRYSPAEVIAPVANVPLGVGVGASLISQVGDRVIQLSELAFSDPADLSYSKYGMVYGAKLMERINQARPTNANFQQNLVNYISDCAQYDITDGTVNMNTLRDSPDTWGTLTANPNPARYTKYVDLTSGTETMVSCSQDVVSINSSWNTVNGDILTVLAKEADPTTSDSDAAVKGPNVVNSYAALAGISGQTAQALVKQGVMKNALNDTFSQLSGGSGLSGLASAQAESQTRNTQMLLGSVGEKAIPVLKIVVECLFIGIFPVLFPLFLMPKIGLSALKNYLIGFVYLQFWGPMFVILHKIMMFYAYQHSQAATFAIGVSPQVNLANIDAVAGANSDITALAGSMMLLIPALAGMVTKGAMAAGSLGESMVGQWKSGAEAAGAMATTGNVSLGEAHFQDTSYLNTNANQTVTSRYNDTQGSTEIAADGSRVRFGGDGSATVQGAASTFGSGNLSASHSMSASLAKEAAQRQSLAENLDSSYSKGKSQVDSTVSAIQDNVRSGRSWDSGLSDSQRASANRMYEDSTGTHEAVSHSNAANQSRSREEFFNDQFTVDANAGLSTGLGSLAGSGKGSGANGVPDAGGSSGNIGGGIGASANRGLRQSQSTDFRNGFEIQNATNKDSRQSEAYNAEVARQAQASYTESHGSEHSNSNTVSHAFENSTNLHDTVSRLKSESMEMSQQKSYVDSHSASIDKSLNNGFLTWAGEKGLYERGDTASLAEFANRMNGFNSEDQAFADNTMHQYVNESGVLQGLGGKEFDGVKSMNLNNSNLGTGQHMTLNNGASALAEAQERPAFVGFTGQTDNTSVSIAVSGDTGASHGYTQYSSGTVGQADGSHHLASHHSVPQAAGVGQTTGVHPSTSHNPAPNADIGSIGLKTQSSHDNIGERQPPQMMSLGDGGVVSQVDQKMAIGNQLHQQTDKKMDGSHTAVQMITESAADDHVMLGGILKKK